MLPEALKLEDLYIKTEIAEMLAQIEEERLPQHPVDQSMTLSKKMPSSWYLGMWNSILQSLA